MYIKFFSFRSRNPAGRTKPYKNSQCSEYNLAIFNPQRKHTRIKKRNNRKLAMCGCYAWILGKGLRETRYPETLKYCLETFAYAKE